ncbi:pilus assembly protein [uncultured Photobacterium sp.]|uniref:pilus assembly protein n=1 Tax=uncultured Photobacterium sp. TaxID=173973 RepID=UPI00261F6061|nr:pilus assembly protein [uncultured Photobacterium sp.]
MYRKQRGAAGVIFFMILPIALATLAFSIQITQQLQAHAKLTEATEVASLALISTSTGKNKPNKKLAQEIVDEYMPFNLNGTKIHVGSELCDYDDGCVQKSGEQSPFSDFIVSATTNHRSWMPYKMINLRPTFKVASTSSTRKYLPRPVDIYFVVDMSQSMGDPFRSDYSLRKFDVVKATISRVLAELEVFNQYNRVKSRVAFIGYHHYNLQEINGERVIIDQIVNESEDDTIADMFNPNKPIIRLGQNIVSQGFQDIPLTEDYDSFQKELNSFRISDPAMTQSWQGVIRAAQVTDEQREYNPEQAIIVLSDGEDTERFGFVPGSYQTFRKKNYLKTLVKKGLCRKIVRNLERKKNRYGEKVKVTFGVIGIDLLLDKSENGFYDCVGENMIFHAKDGADVYKYILNLLNEETGRLKS